MRLLSLLLSAVLLVALAGVASADNGDPNGAKTGISSGQVETVYPADTPAKDSISVITTQQAKDHLAINYAWLMIGGVLVLFMQAGFALVETGFTRAKNAAHTMMMNLVIFALGTVGGFTEGYALMYGSIGLVGVPNLGGLAVLNHELTIPLGGIDW